MTSHRPCRQQADCKFSTEPENGMSKKPVILIVGAGIGGLALALTLLRQGFDVRVFEQATELGEAGAGVQIAADGSRILLALGLGAEMEAVICEASYKEVRLWNTGEARRLFDLGEDSRRRFGAPYWFVHRGDLHRVLLGAVRKLDPHAITTGKRCISFSETDSRIALLFEDGGSAEGDILIGADGVHSQIRSQMFTSPPAEFTGLVAWRGLARMEGLPDELRRPVGANWIGPGGHVITYPLRQGQLLNFVGIVERSDWTVESWSTKGTHEECAQDFLGWNRSIHEIISALDQPFKWALVGRKPLKTWCQGRTALLGDAAHPTLPFLAHGAIMALEDAFILGRCLKDNLGNAEIALQRYEATRMARTTAIVEGSAENAKRFHNPALAEPNAALAYLDDQWEPQKVRQRYDWLFEYDATTAPLAAPMTETLSFDPVRGEETIVPMAN